MQRSNYWTLWQYADDQVVFKSQIPLFSLLVISTASLWCISSVSSLCSFPREFIYLFAFYSNMFIVISFPYIQIPELRFWIGRLAEKNQRGSWNIKSHGVLMHHEIYNSGTEETGVQKNIKIRYLKGGTEVYLKLGALFKHHAYYFIVCLYLLPLTDPGPPCVVMRAGICCDPIDWLTPEFPLLPLWRNPPIRMFIPNRESTDQSREYATCHLDPQGPW